MTYYIDFKESAEDQYLNMLRAIKYRGVFKGDRTGTGTQDLFGYQIQIDLSKGFPLLTTKRMFTRGIFEELLWFMSGSTNARVLQDKNVHIWDEWAKEDGSLGPVYGYQMRHFGRKWGMNEGVGIDQLQGCLDMIRSNPFSRRIIMQLWNPGDLEAMALPPCHMMTQFSVRPDNQGTPKYLDCQMYQRSADSFLGVPFNIASYALLTHILAGMAGLSAGSFVHTFGSVHIYNNHRDQVDTQLNRHTYDLPSLHIKTFDGEDPTSWSIDDFLEKCKGAQDFEITNYNHHPAIKAEVSV
tara:strand:+ start:1648 stop:2538 length:891 start_codon:yes stop_codon:yes gene_type:complete